MVARSRRLTGARRGRLNRARTRLLARVGHALEFVTCCQHEQALDQGPDLQWLNPGLETSCDLGMVQCHWQLADQIGLASIGNSLAVKIGACVKKYLVPSRIKTREKGNHPAHCQPPANPTKRGMPRGRAASKAADQSRLPGMSRRQRTSLRSPESLLMQTSGGEGQRAGHKPNRYRSIFPLLSTVKSTL